jgi:hypothetical protein
MFVMSDLFSLLLYLVIIVVILLVLASSSIKVVQEYERGVIFRLGRLVGPRGPGLFFLLPVLDRMVKIDLRVITLEIPPQEVITRDNVTVRVNAVLYFQVTDPGRAVTRVTARPGSVTWKYSTAFTRTVTLSLVITSCGGISNVITRKSIFTMRSSTGSRKNSPGPRGPTSRPRRKITPRSYSWTTFIDELASTRRITTMITR